MSGYCMILISICFLDLLSTFVGMRDGEIEEKNICYMFFIYSGGVMGFFKAKILMNFVCISVIEFSLNDKLASRVNLKTWEKLTEGARKKSEIYYAITIISYCLFYIVSFFVANLL